MIIALVVGFLSVAMSVVFLILYVGKDNNIQSKLGSVAVYYLLLGATLIIMGVLKKILTILGS